MNGIELFTKLYNQEIELDDCIEVIHPKEENHYIFRKDYGDKEFDYYELMTTLLYKEYKFTFQNQETIKKKLKKLEIEELIKIKEKELKELQESIEE